MQKYEFTGEKQMISQYGEIREIKRIRALIDINAHKVKAGDLGGWIDSEATLSQEGDCWLSENSFLYMNATVEGDVLIRDSTISLSRVEGTGLIDESTITHCRLIGHFDISRQSNVTLVDTLDVNMSLQKTSLKNVDISGGNVDIAYSTLHSTSIHQSLKIVLDVLDNIQIKFSEVFVNAGKNEAFIHCSANLYRVIVSEKRPMTIWLAYEYFTWKHLSIKNMGFVIGNQLMFKSKTTSSLKGLENKSIRLSDGFLNMQSSVIEEEVSIKGRMKIVESHISGYSEIDSGVNGSLVLNRIKLSEAARILNSSAKSLELSDIVCNADDVIVLN